MKESDAVECEAVYEFDGVKYFGEEGYEKAKAIAGDQIAYVGKKWEGKPNALWAAAHDYYEADIVTGPKFGCIHHEPKP